MTGVFLHAAVEGASVVDGAAVKVDVDVVSTVPPEVKARVSVEAFAEPSEAFPALSLPPRHPLTSRAAPTPRNPRRFMTGDSL